MQLALGAGILLFNVESASELSTLAQAAAQFRKVASIAIRVNPDVPAQTHPYISTGLHEHKFGVPVSEAWELYAEAARHKALRVAGISVHIGSQITDIKRVKAAMKEAARVYSKIRQMHIDVEFLDIGGGMGVGTGAVTELTGMQSFHVPRNTLPSASGRLFSWK